MATHVSPSIHRTAFGCPYCNTFAKQDWFFVAGSPVTNSSRTPDVDSKGKAHAPSLAEYRDETNAYHVFSVHVSRCHQCLRAAIWVGDQLAFPEPKFVPIEPNPDLDEDIQRDFNEARDIALASPRGAAALLRLAVQKLCEQLGGSGGSINDDIAAMVAKGLNPMIKQALDAVRVIGNEQVHGGTLDLRDDIDTVVSLFHLVNLIATEMITRPKEVQAVYDKLPQDKRDAIEKRDAKALAGQKKP